MAEPFIAEIRLFGFNFAPKGWALCNGQIMPIVQNTALFSLVGVYFGGDGRVTFGLPNLLGRAVMGAGNGPGLSPRVLGEQDGVATVTLTTSEMAAHTHNLRAHAADPADLNSPTATRALARSNGGNAYAPLSPSVTMAPQAVGLAGGGLPHNNQQPYLTMNYCIALQGVYPPRG